jgi:hypothetical protein
MRITVHNQSILEVPRIVFFQKNEAPYAANTAIAWHIVNVPWDFHTSFNLAQEFGISIKDKYGNLSPEYPVCYGQKWIVTRDAHRDILIYPDIQSVSQHFFEIHNHLGNEVMDVFINKDHRLLDRNLCVFPHQKTTFQYGHKLWMGIIDESIKEGTSLDSYILTTLENYIPLPHVSHLNIYLKGGGDSPVEFTYGFEE